MNETRPKTSRDALIIEAIGDIGELIRRIEDLGAVTRPLVAELENKLAGAVSQIESHVSNEQVAFRDFAEHERRTFEAKLQASLEKAAADGLKAAQKTAHVGSRPAGLSVGAQFSIALVIAIMGALIGIGGAYGLFGRAQADQAAMGRAVMTVWNELDESAKAKIEQAY